MDHSPTMTNEPALNPPQDLERFRTLLLEERHLFTRKMLEAGGYAVSNPHDVALSPVSQLAEKSGIAATSFVRLAKAMGFSGFSDMQKLFRAPLQRAAPATLEDRIRHSRGEQVVPNPDDLIALTKSFSLANMATLDHLVERVDNLPLAETVDSILAARVVYVIGVDRSFSAASYLSYALNRAGVQSVQILGLGSALEDHAAVMAPDDLLIAISFPPYADDTVNVTRAVRARGNRIVAITDSPVSPITERCTHLLTIEDAEFHGFRSVAALMTVVQALMMGIAYRKRHLEGGFDLDQINA